MAYFLAIVVQNTGNFGRKKRLFPVIEAFRPNFREAGEEEKNWRPKEPRKKVKTVF